ncbi:MAG: branched-chain amino acid ABC transporter permease [Acidimicrobiales bacterium]
MPTSVSNPVADVVSDAVSQGSKSLNFPRPVLKWTQLAMLALIVVFSVVAINDGGTRLFTQRVVNGLTNGSIYALAGLAIVLIFKATGVVNFAQGSMGMIGAFVVWLLIGGDKHSMPTWIALLLAIAITAIGAAGIERTLIRPFDPTNHLPIVIVTLALSLILDGIAAAHFGPDQKAMPSIFPTRAGDYFTIFGARVRYSEAGIWLVLLTVMVLLMLLLKRTKIGLAFRSVSSNVESSRLVGINVGRTLQFGWAIAAMVGTLAAYLYSTTAALSPPLMVQILIFAFVSATLGGLQSIGGVIVGAVLIGLLQSMLGSYVHQIGNELSLSAAFVVMMIVLLVRPTGIFGTKPLDRV